MKKLKIRFMGFKTTAVPGKLFLELEGEVKEQIGSDEEVGKMILNAEMHANGGPTRVHIHVVE